MKPAARRCGVFLALQAAILAPAASAPASQAVAAAIGPRPLPATFVSIETRSFPRPAEATCGGDRRIVHVHPPSGLAAALAHARPRTTILAAAGTYSESPGESTALEWHVPSVCLLASGGQVVLQAGAGQKYGISIAAGDAVLEGITVRGFQGSIALDAGRGRTLRRVTIERVRIERPTGDFRDGIVAYGDNRRLPGRPATVDGLLVLDASVSGTDLGISCNAGPCAHWWVEHTRVDGRSGGSGSSGADAFAVEDGRQIVVVDSSFARASADGIDTKARDVVVLRTRVLDVDRNGVKLWHGGDVLDTVLDGTGADAALVGDGPGRYRYAHVLVRRHDPGGSGYVGTWGYDRRLPVRLEIVNSIFAGNATGGFFAPVGSTVSIRGSVFGDPKAKLLEVSSGRRFAVSQLRSLERAGFGRGNIGADPRLVLSGPLRWSTRLGSPARDRGERIPDLRHDLYGRARSLGASPDSGPVESG